MAATFFGVEAVHHPMRCGGREGQITPVLAPSNMAPGGTGAKEKVDEECNKNGLTARRAQSPCAISVTVWP